MTPDDLTTLRRQSFFCLVVFLAYLLLPLAHKWELASHIPRCCCFAGMAGETADRRMVSRLPVPGESRHQHDPSTCPLCQAALGLDKLAFTPLPTLAPAAQSGEDFSPSEPAIILSVRFYFLCASRAPPSSSSSHPVS